MLAHVRPPVKGASLVESHLDLARGIAGKYASGRLGCLPGLDRDDIEQEAILAMLDCQHTYDPGKGPFHSYACTVIHRRLGKLARRSLSLRRPMSPRSADYHGPTKHEITAQPKDPLRNAIPDEPEQYADDYPEEADRLKHYASRWGDMGDAATGCDDAAALQRLMPALDGIGEVERAAVIAFYCNDERLEDVAEAHSMPNKMAACRAVRRGVESAREGLARPLERKASPSPRRWKLHHSLCRSAVADAVGVVRLMKVGRNNRAAVCPHGDLRYIAGLALSTARRLAHAAERRRENEGR